MQAWAAPSTLHITGLRVKERVYVRATHYARHRCAQNTDHLAHDRPFSAFFTEVVCILGAAPPQAATSQPQNGGNDAIQASDTPPEGFAWRKTPITASLKCTASHPRSTQGQLARKYSPSKCKFADFGVFLACSANFFAFSRCDSDAGRTFSRTRCDNVTTLKPTTPLLTPNKGPLKPTSPLHPKTAPKTPISHPQRRWRFQATGRPGRQGLTTVPVGGGGPWPGDQWAAYVANVVKPTQFISPHEDPCYKRRQSKPKHSHFQRKSPRIDDVRNNGAEIHTKNTLD